MGAGAVKITVEHEGMRMVIGDDQLEDYSLSIPSDVHHNADGTTERGRTHVVLVAMMTEDARPLWEEIK